MKAKLAYLCSSTSWGGLEMNHIRNASWMHARGHVVVFFCVEGSPLHLSALEEKLPVELIPKHKKYYAFKEGFSLAKTLKSSNFTHLITRSTRDLSISATVKWRLGDLITTAYFMEMQLGVPKTNLLHTLRYRYLDIWSCPLQWLKMQVESMTKFNNKLVVIPSGLNRENFLQPMTKIEARKSLNLPNDKMIFGLLGRFDPQKGQLLLLEATQKCKNNDFHVILLGEATKNEGDTYYSSILKFIEENELQDRVHFKPFMNNVSIFYKAIDWFVMATKAETFGMVTIESLTSGTPVLGSNAGGTPELLDNEKGGKLFVSEDAGSLAEIIDEIIDNKISYPQHSLEELTVQFDHNSVCEQIEFELNLIHL